MQTEKFKWKNHKNQSTDAESRGGTTRSSGVGFVAAVENTAPSSCGSSNTARGPWYLAWAKALSVGLSNAYFKSLGFPSLFEEVLA